MRTVLIALALLACFPFFWQPVWGQSPSVRKESSGDKKQQTELTGKQSYSDQRGTKNSPVVVDVLGRPKSQAEAAEEKRKEDDRDFRDRWTFYSTIAVAGFTGILVFIGWRGVCAANRTLNEVKRQADVMERQTKVLEGQAAALINSERAWLVVEPQPPNFVSAVDVFNEFRFDISNKGRTVAKISSVAAEHCLFPTNDRLPQQPYYPKGKQWDGLSVIHGTLMVPGDILRDGVYTITEFIDDVEMVRISAGAKVLCVYGFVKYFDFAGVARVNQFCYRYRSTWRETEAHWRLYGPDDYNSHT